MPGVDATNSLSSMMSRGRISLFIFALTLIFFTKTIRDDDASSTDPPVTIEIQDKRQSASKVVGGLDYNYVVKGDSQFSVKSIDVATQKEALNALLKTIDTETLAIPKNKLDLFPPRAFGYWRTRESFNGKTGVAFDPMSVASTASEMTLSLLLHPQRANRMIQQKSLDANQLGLEDLLNTLINNTFKKKHSDAYLNEIQQMVNVNLLQQIMNLAVNDNASFQVNAIANKAIQNTLKKGYF